MRIIVSKVLSFAGASCTTLLTAAKRGSGHRGHAGSRYGARVRAKGWMPETACAVGSGQRTPSATWLVPAMIAGCLMWVCFIGLAAGPIAKLF